MTLEDFIIIVCLVVATLTYGGYRYFSENVKLRFAYRGFYYRCKEQLEFKGDR